jgi:nitrogen fixation NifU-like protein
VGNIVCGDVQWLYIKVGTNKKGEEIIKDIKFETYGCPAAIGTTSVITDLAKGKTIAQALKITNKDVIGALDSLPPIKIHCSLLAEEGLAEAIYDYLSKNKKEIPAELQRKHERIKKEKEVIEKRYKEWMKPEHSN